MKPTVHSKPRAAGVPQRTHFNALTHGLRSGHVLLPGDNVAEFRTLRHRLFHLHKPRTIAEALCVETLAANAWRAARCRAEQRFFKEHLGAAMSGHPDAGGYLCDPDPHRLHHRGTDCQREERGLEISASQAGATLTRLQQQRTQNLNPALAEVLEDYTVFLAEGEPVVEEQPEPATATAPETSNDPAAEQPAESGATGSLHGQNRIFRKRNPNASAVSFPKNWSRRQRREEARRQARMRHGTPG
jgi:hypothetical protein